MPLRGLSYWSARPRWRIAYPELWLHFPENWANVFDLLYLQVVPRKRMVLGDDSSVDAVVLVQLCPRDEKPPIPRGVHLPIGGSPQWSQQPFLVVSELRSYLLNVSVNLD